MKLFLELKSLIIQLGFIELAKKDIVYIDNRIELIENNLVSAALLDVIYTNWFHVFFVFLDLHHFHICLGDS